MSNGGKRDLVRFESNERVDLPDLDAVQANARSESRMTVDTLITGQGVNLWSTAYSALGVNPHRPQLSRWEIQTAGTQITVFAGLAIGGLLDPAADTETGVWFGGDGDASQTIDLAAKPDGDYAIYVKPVFDAGTPGTRIFWDNVGTTETAQAIDTRRLFGWTTNVELLTSPDDGESVIVGRVEITGGAITALEEWYAPIFEAGYIRDVLLGVTSPVTEWWRNLATTDPTLRDPTLGHTNPVTNLADFAAVARSQIADILGLTGAAYWRSARPETTTTNTTGLIGTPVSLTIARDHIDLSTDPHGSDVQYTGTGTFGEIVVNGDATVTGDITVTGEIEFTNPITKYLTIPGVAFAHEPNNDVAQSTPGSGTYWSLTDSREGHAAVYLPDGAQITALKVWFDDNDVTSVSYVYLRRQTLSSGSVVGMASVQSTPNGGIHDVEDTTILLGSVNTELYAYALVADFDLPGGGPVTLRAVRIEYTVSKLHDVP